MMRKRAGLAALRMQRERTLSRLATLADDDWDRPCLPGWAVRDVVAHLVATDQASASGRMVLRMLSSPDRAVVERWNDEVVRGWRERPPRELIEALDRYGRRVQLLARLTPGALSHVPVGGPYGRHPLVFLLYLRVIDEWVHEQDICRATDPACADDVPAPPPLLIGEALAAQVLAVLPRKGLPRVERPVGVVRIVVDAAPPGGAVSARPVVWGVDFARRHYGLRVDAKPDAEIRIGAGALALVQESRVRWRDLAPEWLTVQGDEELAAEVLDAIPLSRPPEPSSYTPPP